MNKNFIIPIIGLLTLIMCAFYYFNKQPQKNTQSKELPVIMFEVKDFYNDKIIDRQELGDFYIVNFFASWCKPCLVEHPLLIEMQSKGIKIIGVNFRDDQNNFNDWIKEHGNPFEYILRDDGEIAYEMGLIGVPETYFIQGSIIQKKIQGPLFYEDIEEYL